MIRVTEYHVEDAVFKWLDILGNVVWRRLGTSPCPDYTQTCDLLLPRFLSGEIRPAEVEKALGVVV